MRVVIVMEKYALAHEMVRTLGESDLLILMGDAVFCSGETRRVPIARSLIDLQLRGIQARREVTLSDAEIIRRIQAARQVTVL